ncbi:MAG TPA: tetratricopeptide repeat protein [Syntrophales bacterium]|nr:tetratricopeptide repeat protein [Syntrophales bacterium]
MAAAKMDKRDLEQTDVFQETFAKILDYARQNRQKLYASAGVFAVVIVLGAGYLFYSASYEKDAGKLYFDARLKAMKADPMGMGAAIPVAMKALADVVEKYPSSDAAQAARYELGSFYFETGEYDRTIQIYTAFLEKASTKDLRTLYARFGIGYAYEAKKEYDKALDTFNKVAGSNPGNVFESLGYRNMARVYEEMNDLGKATEYYKKALEKTKDPAASSLLKRKIAQLG